MISDIDGLLVQPGAASLAEVARAVFAGDASARLPLAGAAALYRALFDGCDGREMNPLFYLSSNPCDLYDLLNQYLALQGFPAGPLLLPRGGLHPQAAPSPAALGAHKLGAIQALLQRYPRLPFLLAGGAEEDRAIFAEVAARYPQRVQVARINQASDAVNVARSAHQQGWVSLEALESIEPGADRGAGPSPVQ